MQQHTLFRPQRVKIFISSQDCCGKVRLRFADDGNGVSDEARPKLFDLFYRTDPARAGSGMGSGLGLAIVKKPPSRWAAAHSPKKAFTADFA